MKKNIYKILFTIVCMFMTVGIVIANSTTGPTGDSGSDSNSSGKIAGEDSDASLGSNGKQYVMGIRVSFYTSTGVKIRSQDYALDNKSPSTLYTQYSSTGDPCGKMDGCVYRDNWYQSGKVKGVSELSNIIGSDVSSAIRNADLSKNSLFGQMIALQDIDKGKQVFNALMVTRNVDEFYIASKEAYNLFLVWEPLGIINDLANGKKYLGTTFELTNKMQNMDDVGLQYQTNEGNYVSIWGGLGRALTQSTGCSTYLEYPSDYVSKVSAKFNTFNASSYFNGKLVKKVDFTTSSCGNMDKNILKNYALDNTSNYAVGVLWFNESFEGPGGMSCQNIYDYYGGKENICNTIISTGTFGFSAFNNKIRSEGKTFPVGAEGGITLEWYNANCGCGPDNNGIDCTPTYNVPSCTTGDNKTLTYKDSTDWEHCIFTDENIINGVSKQNKYTINPHKWSDKNQNLTYYDKNLSSQNGYCDVYCIEEVYGNFDSNNPTVLAGNHFTWGWSQVQTVRTCKTNGINIEKFERDLRAANEEVVQQIANNKLYKSLSGYSWRFTYQNPSDTDTQRQPCSPATCAGFYAPLVAQGYTCDLNGYGTKNITAVCRKSTPGCNNYLFSRIHTCEYNTETSQGCSGTSNCHFVGSTPSGNNIETRTYYCPPSSSSMSASVTVAGITKSANFTDSTSKCQSSSPSSGVSSPKLQDAINKVNEIINDFKKCYEFDNTNVLNDQSKATISYISPNNIYDYSGEMEKSTNTIYNEGTCTVSKPHLTLNGCSSDATDSSHCPTNTRYTNLYNCDSHTEIGDSTTDFSLKGDIYQYVIKDPNDLTLKSVHTSSFNANYKDARTYNYERISVWEYNWTDIGYSNFPVPFIAESKSYSGNLQIEYSNIGHTSTPGSTNVDTILKSVPSYGQYGNWSCGYDVEYDFIEDNDDDDDGPGGGPGDINVIYREIDLYNPFPDTNSRGRHTGANWCSHENCDYDSDNVVVNSYILQNRNVEGDDVYNLDPMYTFVMTPSDIIKIRRYNDNNTYSSYEGTLGGKKYTFTCTRGSLRNCRSDYLSQLLKDLDAVNLKGTCKNDRQVYDTSDASSQFESCRY